MDIAGSPSMGGHGDDSSLGQDVSGDWLFQGSMFGSRLPLPETGADMLDVRALRSLLPLRRKGVAPATHEEENKDTLDLLQRMLRDERRMQALDDKLSRSSGAAMAASDGAAVGGRKRQRPWVSKQHGSQWQGAGPGRMGQTWGARPTRRRQDRPVSADAAPRSMLRGIGMSVHEFQRIDALFHQADEETRNKAGIVREAMRSLDAKGRGFLPETAVSQALEQAEVELPVQTLRSAVEASYVEVRLSSTGTVRRRGVQDEQQLQQEQQLREGGSVADQAEDMSMTGSVGSPSKASLASGVDDEEVAREMRELMMSTGAPPVSHEALSSRLRAALRFDEAARLMGVDHSQKVHESAQAPRKAPEWVGEGEQYLGEYESEPRVPMQLGLDGNFVVPPLPFPSIQPPKRRKGAGLPPVKPGGRSVARKHLVGISGYRPRETPRCLQPGEHASMDELKQELNLAEKGLRILEKAVKDDVQWVQSNCPSDSLSIRAQMFCKQWAGEKLKGAFGSMQERRLLRSWRQWQSVVKLAQNAERLSLYIKFTACHRLVATLDGMAGRAVGQTFCWWADEAWRHQMEEIHSAACEMQKRVRMFLAHIRVERLRHDAAVFTIQSSMRKALARKQVRVRREKKRQAEASRVIQRSMRGRQAVSDAKHVAQRKREDRAARRIQAASRNRHASKGARQVVQTKREDRAVRRIQQAARTRNAKAKVGALRDKRDQERAALAIERQIRAKQARARVEQKKQEKKAVDTLQRGGRGMMARKRVNKMKREQAQAKAIVVMQCAVRRWLSVRRVAKRRWQKANAARREVAACQLQRVARGMLGRRRVAGIRQAKREAAAKDLVARRLQAMERGRRGRLRAAHTKTAREEWLKQEEEQRRRKEEATRLIQRAGRGMLGRRRADVRRKALEEHKARESAAATTIQALVRGVQGRAKAKQRRQVVEEEHRQAGELLDQSATTIQCAWRQKLARKRVQTALEVSRDKEKAREMKRREAAALKAKKEAEAQAEKERLEAEAKAQQEEVERLLREAKEEEERRRYAGAVAFQRIIRGFLGRRKASAAAAKRAAWRAEKEQRRQEKAKHAAAVIIQRLVLGFLASRRMARRKEMHRQELAKLEKEGGAAAGEIEELQRRQQAELSGLAFIGNVSDQQTEGQVDKAQQDQGNLEAELAAEEDRRLTEARAEEEKQLKEREKQRKQKEAEKAAREAAEAKAKQEEQAEAAARQAAEEKAKLEAELAALRREAEEAKQVAAEAAAKAQADAAKSSPDPAQDVADEDGSHEGRDDALATRSSRGRHRARRSSAVDSGDESEFSSDPEDEADRLREKKRRRERRAAKQERRRRAREARGEEKEWEDSESIESKARTKQYTRDDIPNLDGSASQVSLYGKTDEAVAARDIYAKMWARTVEERNMESKGTKTPFARMARANRQLKRFAEESDGSDADSSSDDDMMASKMFASIMSTGRMQPGARDAIRAEAELAMEAKLGEMLESKLKEFEENKSQLLALQESLDQKLKEFSEKEKSFQQMGANAGVMVPLGERSIVAHGEAQDQLVPLQSEWTQVFDAQSQTFYYFNERTGETSWFPQGGQTKDGDSGSEDGYNTAGSKGTAVDYDTDAWEDGGNAAGDSEWSEQYDPEARAYYWFNHRTLEATWTKPEGVGGANQDEWISYIDDESGKEYWYNPTTNETSWEPRV